MTNYRSEKNQRQYRQMLAGLAGDAYDRGTASLGQLISTLEFLLAAVEEVDLEWRSRFQKHWGVLDEVNAYVLDCGRKDFSDEEKLILKREVENLRRTIEEVYVVN